MILFYNAYFRSAEIILTLAKLSGKPGSSWIAEKDAGVEQKITDGRRSLSLFQHHDGITGTAKDHVVIDYGKRYVCFCLFRIVFFDGYNPHFITCLNLVDNVFLSMKVIFPLSLLYKVKIIEVRNIAFTETMLS